MWYRDKNISTASPHCPSGTQGTYIPRILISGLRPPRLDVALDLHFRRVPQKAPHAHVNVQCKVMVNTSGETCTTTVVRTLAVTQVTQLVGP